MRKALATTPSKIGARELIVQYYRKARNVDRLPPGCAYYAMCGDQTMPGSEYDRLVDGFLLPEQFFGIDRNAALIEANRAAHVGNWICDELLDALSRFGAWLKPGIVNLDTEGCVDHPATLRLLTGTMRRCRPGTLVCFNAVAKIPQCMSRVLDYSAPEAAMERDLTEEQLADWVIEAERVAQEHAGTLPGAGWLRNNSLGNLVVMMYRVPSAFAHIQKARDTRRSPAEWVPVAEQLAREHKNQLPGTKWRSAHDLRGLTRAVSVRPELFAHIPQTKLFKTPEEWVSVAEQVTRDHGGQLPTVRWLRAHNLSGLGRSMNRNRELFQHIEQAKRCRLPEDWVLVAEGTARDHGGYSPARAG